jgi:TRAP-type C4-dicarboxylate transport system permease small subunit
METFAKIHHALKELSRWLVWLGGGALLISAIIVTVDVISRKFIGITMSGSDELSGYVFSASTTMAYSYCLLHRSNVRIDAFYNMMPQALRATLDVIGLALLMYYMWFMTEAGVLAFLESWELNSVSITTLETPQWIPQFFWMAGLVLFFAMLIFVTLYSLVALLQRNWDLVGRIAGIPSIADVIEEETHGVDVMEEAAAGREV